MIHADKTWVLRFENILFFLHQIICFKKYYNSLESCVCLISDHVREIMKLKECVNNVQSKRVVLISCYNNMWYRWCVSAVSWDGNMMRVFDKTMRSEQVRSLFFLMKCKNPVLNVAKHLAFMLFHVLFCLYYDYDYLWLCPKFYQFEIISNGIHAYYVI